ncbi:MAG: homocysteine biosynthesis protein [Actinomycetota bacterium]|nr:homocysteine biosynthesis protein [Actinomycetota bacterium]
MAVTKTYEEINEKIRRGEAVVVTAEEIIDIVKDVGVAKATEKVDVITTGTFGPMCSSGAFINFGHSDPPIKMTKVWLNDVPAYAGLAAVDAYIGATELSETQGMAYGGAHVIEDLIAGKNIKLESKAYGTDCYPRKEIITYVNKNTLNEVYLFNPRNAYQNYAVAVNSSARTIYTYMGTLLPRFGNATYCNASQLSPLINDPYYRTIGIGTRIFLGGAQGYVAWQGTQFNPKQARGENGVPLAPAGTLALIGNLKDMSTEFIRAAIFHKYGTSLYVGVGVPIPVLDEDIVEKASVSDKEIYSTIIDYSVTQRSKPSFGRVSYAELRSGKIEINGKKVRTAPISSYSKARKIAETLKEWIKQGKFYLQQPIENFSLDQTFKPLEIVNEEEI